MGRPRNLAVGGGFQCKEHERGCWTELPVGRLGKVHAQGAALCKRWLSRDKASTMVVSMEYDSATQTKGLESGSAMK